MSKITILLCVMVVAALDASANNECDVTEDQIKSNIDSKLSALKTVYNSITQNFEDKVDKLSEKYTSIISHIRTYVDDYAAKAWDKVYDIWVKTSLKSDIEKNLGGYDCFKAIKEVVDKGLELYHSATRCATVAYANIIMNKTQLEARALNKEAWLHLIVLKSMPLCSSRYNKTTQFELIKLCSERFCKQVNEEINKLQQVFAEMNEIEKDLDSLLSDVPDCGNDWNNITFKVDLEEATSEAETCYQQLQLEHQLQTSMVAN